MIIVSTIHIIIVNINTNNTYCMPGVSAMFPDDTLDRGVSACMRPCTMGVLYARACTGRVGSPANP